MGCMGRTSLHSQVLNFLQQLDTPGPHMLLHPVPFRYNKAFVVLGCGEASQTVGLLKVLAQEATDWAQRDFKGLRPGCAGALISDRLVMTAAHCQLSGINAALIQDAYGVGFRNVFIHPRYQPPTFYNNIGMKKATYDDMSSYLSPLLDGHVV